MTYSSHIERSFRFLRLAGVAPKDNGSEHRDPELSGIFVPLHVAPQRATYAQNSQDTILDILQTAPYVVLLGGPGSGKTTITSHLAWSHASYRVQPDASQTIKVPLLERHPLPLRIELRLLAEVRHPHPEYDILAYVSNVLLGGAGVRIDRRFFERLLEQRQMLMLFDGLDEVATLEERRRLRADIEQFVQDYPGNYVLVTSRPVGYELAPCSSQWFVHAKVLSFSDEQIRDFLERWYNYVLHLDPLPPNDRQELETLVTTLKENTRLHTLAENPLLLSVITALHRYERLPERRVLVYDRCADLLLDKWARLKGVDKRWSDLTLSREDQYACVAHLGFVLQQRSQETEQEQIQDNDVVRSTLLKEINKFLQPLFTSRSEEQHIQAQRLLELMQVEAGLIVERGTDEKGETLYGFVHRTFQEYFAAADVEERYRQDEDPSIISQFLAEHLHDPHWREVIFLLFGKLKRKPATAQLRAIFESNLRGHRSKHTELIQQDLFFIGTCLGEEIAVDISLAEQIVSSLHNVAKSSPFPSQRSEAIQILATLLKTRDYTHLGHEALTSLTKKEPPTNPSVRREAIQMLCVSEAVSLEKKHQWMIAWRAFALEPDLPIEQTITDASTLYQSSLPGSQAHELASQLLESLIQRPDLPIEPLIAATQELVQISPAGSQAHERARQVLESLNQRSNLPIEQAIMAAYALYHRSQGYELARQVLESLNQRSNLPIEQFLVATLKLFQREEQGRQLLVSLAQRPDLPFETAITIANTLFSISAPGSRERELVHRSLVFLSQRRDLSIDQAITADDALYHFSSTDSKRREQPSQLLRNTTINTTTTSSQELRAIMVILAASWKSYTEKENAVHELLQLISQERVGQYLAKYWHDSEIESEVSDIPSMITLTQQELLEPEERDAIYRKLYKLVPRFNSEEAK